MSGITGAAPRPTPASHPWRVGRMVYRTEADANAAADRAAAIYGFRPDVTPNTP